MTDRVASAPGSVRGVMEPAGLDDLVTLLRERGYRVIGPTLRDGAIAYEDLTSAAQLPAGWSDEQDGGRYRLRRRPDQARFGYAVGPDSWKRFLFPPRIPLWRARRDPDLGLCVDSAVDATGAPGQPLAFLGVRACELHAIQIQDRVFLGGKNPEPDYARRRQDLFIVAVNCYEPAGTCFCASMGTGPQVESGYDVALSEILGSEHRFLVEAGTKRGAEIVNLLPLRPATEADVSAAREAVEAAAGRMGRQLDTRDLPELLARNLEHPQWDDVAARCLSCGNCTLACPTCFCFSVEDTTDLLDGAAQRSRVWASCFSLEHSYIHGGSVRASAKARYRQWLTHKLGTWWEQFGTAGCVGCGRCITWCPVGIDITAEAAAIRATDGGHDSRT